MIDSVVGSAFGGSAKLTSEQKATLGADRAECPGRWIWEQGVGKTLWRDASTQAWGDFKENSFDFFLDLFIPSLFLKRCYSSFQQRTYAKRSGS